MKQMSRGSLSLSWYIDELEAHSSSKLVENSWCLIWFSFMTRARKNFKPRESKLVCSVLSCVSERFLICCLRNSTVSFVFLLCKFFFQVLRLRFLTVRVLLFLPSLETETREGCDSLCLFSFSFIFDIIFSELIYLVLDT